MKKKLAEECRENIFFTHIGNKHSEETRKKISKSRKGIPAWNKGLKMTESYKKRQSDAMKRFYNENPESRKTISTKTKLAMQKPEIKAKLSRPMSASTKAKISTSMKERWCAPEYRKKTTDSHKGKKFGEKTRAKMRQTALSRIIQNGTMISVGKNERSLLDRQEQMDRCKIERGYNIKGLGYVVDGYCPETNTVYEVYEPFHNRQIFEDLIREEKICKHLSCDFIIVYDKNGSK